MPSIKKSYYYDASYALPPAPPPGPDYIQSVLDLSPSAFWTLQDTTGAAVDSSGNGWNATAGGSPSYQQDGPTINGETFKAIGFNGSDAIFTASSSLTDPSTDGFTISTFVKHAAGAGTRPIFYWLTTNHGTFSLSKGNNYGPQILTWNTSNATHGLAFHGTDLDDTWTWVAARYDVGGNVLRCYRGTATADTSSFTGSWKRDGDPSPRIGGGGGAWNNGRIALVAYWNTPLSDSNMTKLRTGEF